MTDAEKEQFKEEQRKRLMFSPEGYPIVYADPATKNFELMLDIYTTLEELKRKMRK